MQIQYKIWYGYVVPLRNGTFAKTTMNDTVVLKWGNSWDLSAKYTPIMVLTTRNIRNIHAASTSQQSSGKLKPLAVLTYNKVWYRLFGSNIFLCHYN